MFPENNMDKNICAVMYIVHRLHKIFHIHRIGTIK